MTGGPVLHPSAPAEPSFGPVRKREFFRWSPATLFSILILLSVLPYCNTLLDGFVYDDTTQILDNPYILSFRHLGEIFLSNVWSYVGSRAHTNYYRPMMTLGYLICFKIFGAAPYGYHLANVLFHAAVVCMLYILTRRMFQNRVLAFLAAALFALHPIHTESLNWVAAVTDLQVTLFFLLTFWFFLKVPRPGGRRSEWAVLGVAISYVLALLSKEQALVLPALAVVYEHFYRSDRRKTSWMQKASRYTVLWLLVLAYLLFREYALGAFAPVTGHADVTRYEAFLSSLPLIGLYIWKLIWPAHLSAYYPFRVSTSFFDPQVLGGLAAVAGCAVAFAILWKRERLACFGFLWFFATLAPVLNARVLESDNVFAERYLYLPSVGFCWLVAWGLLKLWDKIPDGNNTWRWVWAGSLGVVAVLYAARVVTRNRVWRSETVLYAATLAVAPDAVPIYNNLGSVYWNRGDVAGAEREWRKALSYAPESPTLLNNLGLVYTRRKEFPQAVECFRKAILNKPIFADPHLNLGVAYQEMGRNADAELQYRATINLAPFNVHGRNRLGGLYLDEGRWSEAQKEFGISASIAPNVVAYDGLGETFLRQKAPAAAEIVFKKSVALNPRDARARMNLAFLYTASGRKTMAEEQYRTILKYDPANSEARRALQDMLQSPRSGAHESP
jgi:protein O-mannosyl-transferase